MTVRNSAGPRMVYILGAGVNRTVTDLESVHPPLSADFFPTLLGSRIGARLWRRGSALGPFILRHWKMDEEALASTGLDVEELFTFLEFQRSRGGSEPELAEFVNAEFEAKSMFARYMAHFESFPDEPMKQFAKLAKRQAAGLITFNYDCLLERAFELASSSIGSPENRSGFSIYSWNRALAYGFEFDEIELGARPRREWVGRDYYDRRPLYSSPLLKLHGSVSWHRYLPVHSFLRGVAAPEFPEHLAHRLVMPQYTSLNSGSTFRNGWMLDPVLITPVLLKEQYYRWPVFQMIWKVAELSLQQCEHIAVIGYSFPPTDVNIRNLLRLVVGNRPLSRLTVVNPCDEAERRAVAATSFTGEVERYQTLTDYVSAMKI